MKTIRFSLLALCVLCFSACGTGKFFIERAVNSIEEDIADEINGFADFDEQQRAEIEKIALRSSNWVKADRLDILGRALLRVAEDVEQEATITQSTWDSTVAFIEQPFTMSSVDGLIEQIAELCFSLTDKQAKSALKKMSKEHKKAVKEQAQQTLEEQNRKFLRGLKIVFSEMGIARSKEQINMARQMLAKRQSHIDLDWQEQQRSHDAFVRLISDRSASKSQYVAEFTKTWIRAEQGAKHRAPEKWQHNASVAHSVMIYLLKDLSGEQRTNAANNIREYANLFLSLSSTK